MDEGIQIKLKERLGALPAVSVAYLFGSVAKGCERPGSDIDIAILFQQGLSKWERFQLRLEIAGLLEDIAGRQVDVVDLEEATLLLQHQVRRHGIVMVERERQRRVDFEVRSRREFFDFLPYLEYRNNVLIGKRNR
ncbi:nucleotidyltransferase domain-containing protein [Heliobacterium undosum]|uniref:Nucleotidyltransferase domain-containing protein n=1 Tax=Heliomicrobium undosum TaxID=121734 RepID=A0A845L6M3_9FIRM|nr:nucleotidyltransferase domain-containing protein [Heliomicrobium undosum]MZP30474.1 nucleotidyltransferase domain-containing protein [Heliomicrobium undosum]